MSQFITETSSISSLLTKIEDGELGIPEFQRPFKWDRERMRGLLVSILNDYPTGSLLFYCPGDPKLFGRRPFAGAPPLKKSPVVTLALDGQQRLTSLYHALRGKSDVRFYLNVKAVLTDADVEEWVTYAVPEWRKRRGKDEWYIRHYWLLTPSGRFERFDVADEKARALLPLSVLTDDDPEWSEWLRECGNYTREQTRQIGGLRRALLHEYKLPVIMLGSSTAPDQVCFIFEKINSSGLMLSLFELLNAKLYRAAGPDEPGMNLAKMWEAAQKKHERLQRFGVKDLFFLQTLALLNTRDKTAGCKRKDIFAMTVEEVRELWPRALAAVDGVLGLMEEHAGIRSSTWFPFPTMIPALAVHYDAHHADLRGRPGYSAWVNRMMRWYWCSVFTNRFTNAVETKLAGDMRALREWEAKGDTGMPEVVRTFRFSATSLRHARTRWSAIYQGAFCLVLRNARDFHQNTPMSWERIRRDGADDHHIFPKATLRGHYDGKIIDCVLNRTLIDAATNKVIRDKKPSRYISIIRASNPSIDAILASHAIPGGDESPERDDDFLKFLDRRERLLGQMIAEATGGEVTDYALPSTDEAEDTESVVAMVPDDADDGNEDALDAPNETGPTTYLDAEA